VVARWATPVKVLVIEDDPDVQLLIETVFSLDSRFSVVGVAAAAEDGLGMAGTTEPDVIVLDHGLAGDLTGLKAAPMLKAVAPQVKIILFTAHEELRGPAEQEPAIDAYVLKTDSVRLLPEAQQLSGIDQPAG